MGALYTVQLTESSTKETRKQFDALIVSIKKRKEPIALVTDTVDRLQRSFRETPLLDELRKEGRIELHFLREGLVVSKESNSSQLLQWDIGVLFASSYVRQHSDNIKRSIEQGWRNGEWFSMAPFGYKNQLLPDGKKTIIIDPDTSHFVIKMFQLYASGNHSLNTIVLEMNNLGLRTTSGQHIVISKVERILKNLK
jgi:site-specific DNA recombinase